MGRVFGVRGALGATLLACAGAAFAASPALAAQSQQTVECNGQTVIVRTNDNHSSQNGGWDSVKIISGGSGTATPTSFSGTLVDTSNPDEPIVLFAFDQTKGQGNANHNQQAITCTETIPGTVGDFWDPAQPLPSGINLTDPATFTLTVTAVPQGQSTIGGGSA